MRGKLIIFLIIITILTIFLAYCSLSPMPQQNNTNGGTGGGGQTTIDTNNPTVSITYPNNGDIVISNVTVSGTASDIGSGVKEVWLKLNNGSYGKVSGTTSWSSNLSGLSDGTNTIYVYALDNAGNTSTTQSVSFVVVTSVNTVTINVSNNAYGIKLGVGIAGFTSGSQAPNYFYVSPSTNLLDFSQSLLVPQMSGISYSLVIYHDLDNDNNLKLVTNIIPGQTNVTIVEPILFLATNVLITGNTNFYFTLKPHTINGTISGDSGGFSKVVIIEPQSSGPFLFPFYVYGKGNVSSGSYEVKFYLVDSSTNEYQVVAFKDNDNNGYLDSLIGSDEYVIYSNTNVVSINPSTPSTNTCDFNIKKVRIVNSLSGTDSSQFAFIDGFRGMFLVTLGITNYYTNSYTNTVYFDNVSGYSTGAFIIAFKDGNNNKVFDTKLGDTQVGEVGYYDPFVVSSFNLDGNSSSTIVNTNVLGKYQINLTISGSYNTYPNPSVWSSYIGGGTGTSIIEQMIKLSNQTSLVYDVYYITNLTAIQPLIIGIVADTNTNGANWLFDEELSQPDPFIATNGNGTNATIITGDTSITLYITN